MEQHPLIETVEAAEWTLLECPICPGYAVRLRPGGRGSDVVQDAAPAGIVHSWTP